MVAELRDIPAPVLVDADAISAALRAALAAAGADVRRVVSERFAPQGVTAVAVLAESHASVHTWPEHAMAFVDVFTCGGDADPVQAVKLLAESLGAGRTSWSVLDRGGPPRAVREEIGAGLRREWDIGAVHWAGQTGYQHVQIADTAHGVTLFCDGERQSAELSQLVYHEALFVPAALLADRCTDVLVIGSSEGVVSQLAVACGAQRVDHVDIDRACVRACAEHLPYGYPPEELAAAERGEGQVRVHYADGAAFVTSSDARDQRWDVIVVDLPDESDDPSAQHNRLYGAEFLGACATRLRPGGVLASQAGCPTLWRNAHAARRPAALPGHLRHRRVPRQRRAGVGVPVRADRPAARPGAADGGSARRRCPTGRKRSTRRRSARTPCRPARCGPKPQSPGRSMGRLSRGERRHRPARGAGLDQLIQPALPGLRALRAHHPPDGGLPVGRRPGLPVRPGGGDGAEAALLRGVQGWRGRAARGSRCRSGPRCGARRPPARPAASGPVR